VTVPNTADIPEVLLRTFRDETDELLAELERGALDLGAGGDDLALLETMYRGAHTLKGNASCLGFDAMTEVAHHLEGAMSAAIASRRGGDRALIALVLESLDVLGRLATGDEVAAGPVAALGAQLAAWAAGAVADGEPTADPVALPPSAPPAERGSRVTRAIRVDVGRLDHALDLVGEIAVTRGRLVDAHRRRDAAAVDDALEIVDALVRDLRAGVLALRLVPLRTSFERFRRAVRDLGRAAGKEVRLELACDDLEVDVSVAEALRAPLTHLLRNAIDHGIETPAARRRAGKPATGTLTLAARQEGASLVVELTDDGAGLARDALLERGRALGVAVDGLSDAQIWELAFVPGLSTATRVTDLSGRGIGMDVVRRTLEAMRGGVRLASVDGRGVTASLCLPLTLSILQGLAVGVGGDVYVLPLDHVVECVDLAGDRAIRSVQGGVVELRGEALPYLSLARSLGSEGGRAPGRIVVVEHDGTRAGLAVDCLHGEVQTVIKPLGPLLDRVHGLTGSALLADGRVALVVDVRGLLRAAAA